MAFGADVVLMAGGLVTTGEGFEARDCALEGVVEAGVSGAVEA